MSATADKRGPGRPPLGEGKAKAVVLSLRFTEGEVRAMDRAARAAGKARSTWAREAVVRAARATASDPHATTSDQEA